MQQNIDDILKTIDSAIVGFQGSVPGIQQIIVDELQPLIKQMDVRNGQLLNNVNNLKLIGTIKNKLQKIIVSAPYKDAVDKFIESFDQIGTLQLQYFAQFNQKYTPGQVLPLIKQLAIETTVNDLIGQGMKASVVDPIISIITQNTTTGGSYADFNEQLRNEILTNGTGDGSLARYTKQITTDAVNQFNAQYTEAIAQDLKFRWIRYVGSLITTSREFCVLLTEKEWIHESELPGIIEGMIDGHQCKLSKTTKLPLGMIPGTNAENFKIRRGGYLCGHQAFWVPDSAVPKEILAKFATGKTEPVPKKEPEPAAPVVKTLPPFKPVKDAAAATRYATETLGAHYADFKGIDMNLTNEMLQTLHTMKQMMPAMLVQGTGSAQKANAAMKKDILDAYKKSGWYKQLSETYGQTTADRQAKAFANGNVSKLGVNTIAWSTTAETVRIPGAGPLDVSKYKGVFVNEKYGKSKKTVDDVVEKSEASGWFTKSAKGFAYIMNHEIGHEIDKIINFRSNPKFTDIYNREHKLGIQSVIERLSKYGATAGGKASHKPAEMIAEAWAEFVGSKNPRPLSKEIGELMLHEYYLDHVQGTIPGVTFKSWVDETLKIVRQ